MVKNDQELETALETGQGWNKLTSQEKLKALKNRQQNDNTNMQKM